AVDVIPGRELDLRAAVVPGVPGVVEPVDLPAVALVAAAVAPVARAVLRAPGDQVGVRLAAVRVELVPGRVGGLVVRDVEVVDDPLAPEGRDQATLHAARAAGRADAEGPAVHVDHGGLRVGAVALRRAV